MNSWPFTKKDWASVQDAVFAIANASYAEDEKKADLKRQELYVLLDNLALKYGPHPVLFETRADLTVDPAMRVKLYKEAISKAEQYCFQTATIRMSLAEVLMEDFYDYNAAKVELSLCEKEVASDDYEEWKMLMERASA